MTGIAEMFAELDGYDRLERAVAAHLVARAEAYRADDRQQMRAAWRRYTAAYRARKVIDREKARQNGRDHYARNRDGVLQKCRDYYASNRERINARRRAARKAAAS